MKWQKTKKSNTLSKYSEFIVKNPNSKYLDSALIKRAEVFKIFKSYNQLLLNSTNEYVAQYAKTAIENIYLNRNKDFLKVKQLCVTMNYYEYPCNVSFDTLFNYYVQTLSDAVGLKIVDDPNITSDLDLKVKAHVVSLSADYGSINNKYWTGAEFYGNIILRSKNKLYVNDTLFYKKEPLEEIWLSNSYSAYKHKCNAPLKEVMLKSSIFEQIILICTEYFGEQCLIRAIIDPDPIINNAGFNLIKRNKIKIDPEILISIVKDPKFSIKESNDDYWYQRFNNSGYHLEQRLNAAMALFNYKSKKIAELFKESLEKDDQILFKDDRYNEFYCASVLGYCLADSKNIDKLKQWQLNYIIYSYDFEHFRFYSEKVVEILIENYPELWKKILNEEKSKIKEVTEYSEYF